MESTREVILLLKQVKNEKQLSFDKILAMMEDNGQFLSKSTLSRVFADGSEDNGNFRYETLRPIADVLLDIEHIETYDTTDTKAYKTILKLQKEIIDELKSSNEQMEMKLDQEKIRYAEQLQLETEKFQRSNDFLRHQITLKDQRIDALLSNCTELMTVNNQLLRQLMECPLRKSNPNDCREETK